MAAALLIKDGKMQLRDGAALTNEACCYLQAVKCFTGEPIDFWALSSDVDPADRDKAWIEDGCFVQWGEPALCLPEGATMGDVGGIDYEDECDGYKQAFTCEDDTPIDRWILASEADGGVFKDGDDCVYWGDTVPCLPEGATLGGTVETYYATCEECEEECVACDTEQIDVAFSGITICCSRYLLAGTSHTWAGVNATFRLNRIGDCIWGLTDCGAQHLTYSGEDCTGTPSPLDEVDVSVIFSGGVWTVILGAQVGSAVSFAFSGSAAGDVCPVSPPSSISNDPLFDCTTDVGGGAKNAAHSGVAVISPV